MATICRFCQSRLTVCADPRLRGDETVMMHDLRPPLRKVCAAAAHAEVRVSIVAEVAGLHTIRGAPEVLATAVAAFAPRAGNEDRQ